MGTASSCSHADQIKIVADLDNIPGCEDCLKIGGQWVNLLVCLTCGHVGCCDSSPNRHARKHSGTTGHPIAQTAKPGEDWRWCYIDEVYV
jgi:uncharacterized UBP type Zn finger protein